MICTGSMVQWIGPPPEPDLKGIVAWMSDWRSIVFVKITDVPTGNALQVGATYPFRTKNWAEA